MAYGDKHAIDAIKYEKKFLQIVSDLFNNVIDVDKSNQKMIRKVLKPSRDPESNVVRQVECNCCSTCCVM